MLDIANTILIVFGGIFFLIGIFALFKMLTNPKRILSVVDGDILAFLSLIAFVLLVIGSAAYWIAGSIDFYAARSFRRYIHTFPETYIAEGALCLLITYGISKIKSNERLSEGKKILIIAGGTLFGLLGIYLGVKKMFGN